MYLYMYIYIYEYMCMYIYRYIYIGMYICEYIQIASEPAVEKLFPMTLTNFDVLSFECWLLRGFYQRWSWERGGCLSWLFSFFLARQIDSHKVIVAILTCIVSIASWLFGEFLPSAILRTRSTAKAKSWSCGSKIWSKIYVHL